MDVSCRRRSRCGCHGNVTKREKVWFGQTLHYLLKYSWEPSLCSNIFAPGPKIKQSGEENMKRPRRARGDHAAFCRFCFTINEFCLFRATHVSRPPPCWCCEPVRDVSKGPADIWRRRECHRFSISSPHSHVSFIVTSHWGTATWILGPPSLVSWKHLEILLLSSRKQFGIDFSVFYTFLRTYLPYKGLFFNSAALKLFLTVWE